MSYTQLLAFMRDYCDLCAGKLIYELFEVLMRVSTALCVFREIYA